MDESSGIADSKSYSGSLWVQQDSGNPPELIRINYQGNLISKVFINGVQNRDWEDLSIANGPKEGVNYIYLADIGDNSARNSKNYIYRFPEPAGTMDTVHFPDKITFYYPEAAVDAEAILVDQQTKDIYIITKGGVRSKIYKLAYPQSITEVMPALLVGELPFSEVVSAAMSENNREIIIKTYGSLRYWTRVPGESIETTLAKKFDILPYLREVQGEALCFRNDNSGFFTLSERPFFISSVSLNFYKRN